MWGRYRRWPRLRLFLIAFAILGIAIYLRAAKRDTQPQLAAFSDAAVARSGPCEVLAVIDGDTLLIKQPASGPAKAFVGKVRLLGINTPETVHEDVPPQPFGPEATQFLKTRVAAGQVRLEL